jgi:hypothetical protein
MEFIWVYVAGALAVYAAYLQYKNGKLEEQNEDMADMIMAMAKELQEYGSPNVRIFKNDEEE